MSDKMPCHISDGPQTPEDIPFIGMERDMDDDDREEWIRDRDDCQRTMLKCRLDTAIHNLDTLGLMAFNDVVQLLKDCRREIA